MQFHIHGLRFKNVSSIDEHLKNAKVEFSLMRGRKIVLSDDNGNKQLLTANKIFEELRMALQKAKNLKKIDEEPVRSLYKTCESLKNKGYDDKDPNSSWHQANPLTRLITSLKHFVSNMFKVKLPDFQYLKFNLEEASEDQQKEPTFRYWLENDKDLNEAVINKDKNDPKAEVPIDIEKEPPYLDQALNNEKEVGAEVHIENDKKAELVLEQKKEAELKKPQVNQALHNVQDLYALAKQNAIAIVTANPEDLNSLDEGLKYDREVVKAAAMLNGLVLRHVKDRYGNDEEIGRLAISNNVLALSYVTETWQKDHNMIALAISKDPIAYDWIHPSCQKHPSVLKQTISHPNCTKSIALEIVSIDGSLLTFASDELKKNKDVCKIAFKQNPSVWNEISVPLDLSVGDIRYALKQATCPESFMLDQIKEDASLMQFCFLKSNELFVTKALDINPLIYEYLNEKSKNNPNVMKQVVKHSKCSKKITLEILSKDGLLLTVAKKEFQKDHDVCLTAFKQNPAAWNKIKIELNLSFADVKQALEKATCPKSFVLKQVEKDIKMLQYCYLKSNPQFVREAIEINPEAYEFIDNISQKDNQVMKQVLRHPNCSKALTLKILSKNGLLLPETKAEFQQDHDVCLTAFKQNPKILTNIPIQLKLNSADITQALQNENCPKAVAHAQVEKEGMLVQFCHPKLIDKVLARKAVTQNGLALRYLGKNNAWDKDDEIIELAIKNNPRAYEYVNSSKKLSPKPDYYKIEKQVIKHPDCPRDIAIEILSKCGHILDKANPKLLQDVEVCYVAFMKNPKSWDDMSKEVQEKLDLTIGEIKRALGNDSVTESFVSFQLKKDGMLINDCKSYFRNESRYVKIAVAQNGLALQYCNSNVIPSHDKDIALIAIESNPNAYQFVKDGLKKSKEILKKTIQHPLCSENLADIIIGKFGKFDEKDIAEISQKIVENGTYWKLLDKKPESFNFIYKHFTEKHWKTLGDRQIGNLDFSIIKPDELPGIAKNILAHAYSMGKYEMDNLHSFKNLTFNTLSYLCNYFESRHWQALTQFQVDRFYFFRINKEILPKVAQEFVDHVFCLEKDGIRYQNSFKTLSSDNLKLIYKYFGEKHWLSLEKNQIENLLVTITDKEELRLIKPKLPLEYSKMLD